MLELKNITRIYKSKGGNKTTALNDISLKIGNSGMIFIVGKSGSGKSTLLNILGGLDRADSGELIINGKSSKKLSKSEMDSYRNTYIGFVFQEFNILEEFTVYQNIELALELQQKTMEKDRVDKLLNLVDLEGYGNRKPNELSGGEKQRVAIARAIVKKPDIIMCDEPTGSLDSKTGEQVFNILKKLSKQKLVIVVSHDLEAAKKYGDRVIEFKDGSIISDINNLKEDNSYEPFKLIKSHLASKNAFRIALSNFKHKKIRLVLTIVLTAIALTFLGVSESMSSFKIEKSHARAMIEGNQSLVQFIKNAYNDEHRFYMGARGIINNDDLLTIQDSSEKKISKGYKIYENGEEISLDINNNFTTTTGVYYSYFNRSLEIIELSNLSEFTDDKLIGKFPEQLNEIVINKYIADYIMYYGIIVVDDQGVSLLYKPTSYEQIINDQKDIMLGSLNKVKIVGIIDQDLSEFDDLKTTSFEVQNNDDMAKYNKLTNIISIYGDKIIVKEGFVSNLVLSENNFVDTSRINLAIKTNDEFLSIYGESSYLKDSLNLYTNEGYKQVEQINDNEIIVDANFLDQINNNEFSLLLNKYKELDPINNTDEKINEFIIKYIQDNNVIGKVINIKISDYISGISDEYEMKIIGISTDTFINNKGYMNRIIFSENIISKYIKENIELSSLYLREDNEMKLMSIFRQYPIEESSITAKTIFSDNIMSIIYFIDFFKNVAFYFSLAFFLFSTLLLTNFIIVSISYRKKEIGILRAIGARGNDVFKIFLIESLLLASISLVISYIGSIIITNRLNNYIAVQLFSSIKPILFGITQAVLLIGVVLLITFISNLIPIKKISKMKPIDAILNK